MKIYSNSADAFQAKQLALIVAILTYILVTACSASETDRAASVQSTAESFTPSSSEAVPTSALFETPEKEKMDEFSEDISSQLDEFLAPVLLSNAGLPGEIAFTVGHHQPSFGLENKRFVMKADGSELRELFGFPSGSTTPIPSPDGTHLLYVAEDKIFIHEGGDSSSKREIMGELLALEGVDWAHDGNSIVFSSDSLSTANVIDPEEDTPTFHDLFMVNIDGTGLVQLTNVEGWVDSNPKWSPLGSRILFTCYNYAGRPNFERVCLLDLNTSTTWIMSLSAGQVQWVAQDTYRSGSYDSDQEDANLRFGSPIWSPDGSQIAFIVGEAGSSDASVQIVNSEGGQLQEVLGPISQIYELSWSPDGDYILFTLDRNLRGDSDDVFTRASNLYAVPIDGSKQIIQLTDQRQNGADLSKPVWWPTALGNSSTTAEIPTDIDAITPTPTPALTPYAVTPIPLTPVSERIEPGNAASTTEIGRVGTGLLHEVTFSPDGRLIAVSAVDGVYVYDAVYLVQLHHFNTGAVFSSVEFAPSGEALITGDNVMQIWSVIDGSLMKTIEGSGSWIVDLAFSPDGQRLISGSTDSSVDLWDIASGLHISTLEGHQRDIMSVAFSPDGRTLASGSVDSTIRLWDATDYSLIATRTLGSEGQNDMVRSLDFSPDGRMLAIGSNTAVRLWSTTDVSILNSLDEESGIVTALTYAPNGEKLAAITANGILRLYDLASWSLVSSFEGHTSWTEGLDFAPDGQTLASASYDGSLRLWNAATGQLLATRGDNATDEPFVGFTPDGRTLVTQSSPQTILLWDVANGIPQERLNGQASWIGNLDSSPDGRTLATLSGRNEVLLWDVATGQLLTSLTGHTGKVMNLAFSPDGRTLATSALDSTVRLWDVTSGSMLATFDVESATNLAFAPDGGTLATGSDNGALSIWDAINHRLLDTRQLQSGISGIAYSPDGKSLASSNEAGVFLWEVTAMELVPTRQLSTRNIYSLTFSPDGKILATATFDVVQLWDMANFQLLASLTVPMGGQIDLAFSSDGQMLASEAGDGAIRLWGVSK